MDKKHAGFILEAVTVLKEQDTLNDTTKFIRDVKHILDSRFKGDWNVLIGKTVGYAMKTRKKASIVLSSDSGLILICWRSPGFEVEDLDTVKMKTSIAVKEKDDLLEASIKSKSLNVVSSPTPDSEGYTVDTPKVLEILDCVANDIRDMDHNIAARHIRSQYVSRISFSLFYF